jgi:hypothetical protein
MFLVSDLESSQHHDLPTLDLIHTTILETQISKVVLELQVGASYYMCDNRSTSYLANARMDHIGSSIDPSSRSRRKVDICVPNATVACKYLGSDQFKILKEKW